VTRPARRCQRFDCPRWIELDAVFPADDPRRYCSDACERKDAQEIRATERARLLAAQDANRRKWQRKRPLRWHGEEVMP
jgi:hypothetical protein